MKPYEERRKNKKIHLSSFRSLHLDLDLDLAQNHLNCAKQRIWELESKKSTSCSAPFTKSIPPSKMTNFRVSAQNLKNGGGAAGMKGVATPYIGTNLTEVQTLK